jgi:hypothetical protein
MTAALMEWTRPSGPARFHGHLGPFGALVGVRGAHAAGDEDLDPAIEVLAVDPAAYAHRLSKYGIAPLSAAIMWS